AVAPDGPLQGSLVMMQRALLMFSGLFAVFVVLGFFLGTATTTLVVVQAFAYSLVALALNIKCGHGGLFNFGILGLLMLGGAAVTFVSYPVNPEFWGSEGPMMLGRALLAFAAGALLVFGVSRADRIGITGRWKTTATILAWALAYLIYRSQIDPA